MEKDFEYNSFTDEELAKLPKWALEKIEDLTRERKEAVRELNEYLDSQTPSSFYTDEFACLGLTEKGTPNSQRRFFQTDRIEADHKGVHLSVYLGVDGIEISWGAGAKHGRDVAFIPRSYQHAWLISKDSMR